MPLLPEADVTNLLPQSDLPPSQITVAMRLVAGWLKTAAGLAALPDGLADEDPLFPAALELTVLVVTNPELLAGKTVGPTSRSWPLAQRRDAILTGVRNDARVAAAGPGGSFPAALPWPDLHVFPAGGWTT